LGGCGDDGPTDPGGGLPDDPAAPADPPADPPPAETFDLTLTQIASGLSQPVHLTAPVDDPRLFISEKVGRIRVVAGGQLQGGAYLDISSQVSGGSEQGLLSIAFHPDFEANGYVFVSFTDGAGRTRVVRYTESPNGLTADPASASDIFTLDQPAGNHNGGHVVFGPDGMLYVALGDGGGAGDTFGNGQDRTTLLGSILRIDVDAGTPFAVPPGNPYIGHASFRPEIWMWGVRNPWRIDFDADRLYVADVGQSNLEEVTVVPATIGGLNLGWNVLEGSSCFNAQNCDPTGTELPQLEYPHSQGCSITGGHAYRGSAMPELAGVYFYSDFCGNWLRSFRYDAGSGQVVDRREWNIPSIGQVLSFGEDASGELYMLSSSGAVYRLDPAAAS
jgi:glucose/arabinose dehydrogenase